MNLFHWLAGRFSSRGKALTSYKRGMTRAKRHDRQGALEDYTATISMRRVPGDVKAMALYNRALVYAADGEDPKAIVDLNAVLAMAQAQTSVKAEARRKLVRMQRRSGNGHT